MERQCEGGLSEVIGGSDQKQAHLYIVGGIRHWQKLIWMGMRPLVLWDEVVLHVIALYAMSGLYMVC